MGGGLMQLVAYGAQDIYLTGNPQITFFKVVYRRHTNFSVESVQQTLSGTVGFGNSVSCTLSRNGDLVGPIWLELDTTPEETTTVNPLHSVIDTIELEIGGQRVDKHYGLWMQMWSDLTNPNPTGSNNTSSKYSKESGLSSDSKFLVGRKESTRVSGFFRIRLGARTMTFGFPEIPGFRGLFQCCVDLGLAEGNF